MFTDKFVALSKLGVGEFAHLNGSLESHLLGTYALLNEWGNPEPVCDAGLFHAVYGTQPMKALGIPHNEYSESDRPKIRSIIGADAEALVYLYGACDRDYFYPRIGAREPMYRDRFTGEERLLEPGLLSNLLEITIANELEICAGSKQIMEENRTWFTQLFDRFDGLVSPQAWARYRQMFWGTGLWHEIGS